MQWKDDLERTSIYASADNDHDREILVLVEDLAENFEDGVVYDTSKLYTPDQIANALLLLTSNFDEGEAFYQALSPIERGLVNYMTVLVLNIQREDAAAASHKGEADEDLSDNE